MAYRCIVEVILQSLYNCQLNLHKYLARLALSGRCKPAQVLPQPGGSQLDSLLQWGLALRMHKLTYTE